MIFALHSIFPGVGIAIAAFYLYFIHSSIQHKFIECLFCPMYISKKKK